VEGKTNARNLHSNIYSNRIFSEHSTAVSQNLKVMFVALKKNPMLNCYVTPDAAIPFP